MLENQLAADVGGEDLDVFQFAAGDSQDVAVDDDKVGEPAVAKLANVDLVLIDTAGSSPRDAAKVAELQAILAAAEPDEVQLVLSTVASEDALRQAMDRFSAVGATSIVLSKLDEAEYLGGVASVLWKSDLPLSYVTYGQNVPDDIGPAVATDLAQRIFTAEVPETSLAYPTA